jgi:hypothetical protein
MAPTSLGPKAVEVCQHPLPIQQMVMGSRFVRWRDRMTDYGAEFSF